MIHYLSKDNKKLKKEIEFLNKISPVDTHAKDILKKKEEEIISLNLENKKLKDEINQLKYAEKTIDNLQKKISILNDNINSLKEKNISIKEENERYQDIIKNYNNNSGNNTNIESTKSNNKKIMSIMQRNKINKILSINSKNNSNSQNIIFRQRSSSLNNIRKKQDIKFCSTSKNFYKLFNESEQKAISTLFDTEEELNIFKQKIGILENRNLSVEKKFTKEIKDLKKIISEKNLEIKDNNIKIRENEIKIKVLKNKSKEKMGNNDKKNEKKLNVDQQLKDFGYAQKLRTKNEQIEKLNTIINNLRAELNKNNISNGKEKELNDITNELGIKGVIDVKKILNNEIKIFDETLFKIIQKEVDIFIQGNINTNSKTNNNEKELNNIKILKNVSRDNRRNFSNYNNYKKSSYSLTNKRLNNVNSNVVSFSLQKGKKK